MPPASTTPSFQEHARRALQAVIAAFGDVVETAIGELPGPTELGRRLGLDKKLAWKVVRIVQSPDPFAIVDHIPGDAGVEIFLDAAAQAGASATAVDDARTAYDEFLRVVEVHAGDRASLAMMARAWTDDTSPPADVAHRREAFHGNSYTWGVQARTQLSANIVMPSQQPGRVDVILLSGLIGLRRLRPKVAWIVARLGFVGGEDDQPPRPGLVPVDRVPLLEPFCSKPPPALRPVATADGTLEIELDEGPVGATGAMTCIFCGDPIRGAGSVHRSAQDPRADLNVHVRTPCRVLVHDLVVHEGLFGRLEPSAAVYSEVHHEIRSARDRDERYRLPVQPSVDRLGRGPHAARSQDVPHYPDMLRHVLVHAGADPDRYDVYRLRMEYPVVPTAVTMSFDLLDPDAPSPGT